MPKLPKNPNCNAEHPDSSPVRRLTFGNVGQSGPPLAPFLRGLGGSLAFLAISWSVAPCNGSSGVRFSILAILAVFGDFGNSADCRWRKHSRKIVAHGHHHCCHTCHPQGLFRHSSQDHLLAAAARRDRRDARVPVVL